jgi:hypothetical protein
MEKIPGTAYTAIIKRDGAWWIGWVEEVTGVNSQERTRGRLLKSLAVVLREALEMNRADARHAAVDDYEEVALVP